MWNDFAETYLPTFYRFFRRHLFCYRRNEHRPYQVLTSVFVWDYCKDCNKKLTYRRR